MSPVAQCLGPTKKIVSQERALKISDFWNGFKKYWCSEFSLSLDLTSLEL